MRRTTFASLTLFIATAAAGTEVQAPRVALSHVDWNAAAASTSDYKGGSVETIFTALNVLTGRRFAGIGMSTVPVLLPIDIDKFRDDASGSRDAIMPDTYFGSFYPSKFFLAGPAGYTATFFIKPADEGFDFKYTKKPIEVEITGAAFTYDLDPPDHQEVFTPKNLQEQYPAIRRILRDAHVRYAFERFGVPYVVSIQCYDRPPSRRYLSCREADPIAERFLRLLHVAGGTPSEIQRPRFDLSRPEAISNSFTYYEPGNLIPNTGWNKLPGRNDRHVYTRIRFPLANAPAYVKSQSFMPWGDCYRGAHTGHMGKKGSIYRCNVNGIPLVFDESAAANFSYPWRDNFCEVREFIVGQCPAGHGHQGEDIRPSNCVLSEENSDRCLPYQHRVAAVRDGMVWRRAGNLGLWIVVNTPNDLVRFRYLHMNPKMLDQDGMVSGRKVREGEIIGAVGTWGDYPRGTSYHIHFNIQVFTKSGWAWVSPYMTLVLAYERLIGARGVELKAGDPPPPIPDKPPVILPSAAVTMESSASGSSREKAAHMHKTAKRKRHHHVSRRHHVDHRRRHHRD